jgi:hypothetical protein
MKVITLWQPWASFISYGWKTIETRTHARFKNLADETIGVHAGNSWDKDWKELASSYLDNNQINITENFIKNKFDADLLRGRILCTTHIETLGWLCVYDSRRALIDCSYVDYQPYRFGLYLKDIKPIPAKGKRGIWNYDFKPGELVYL